MFTLTYINSVTYHLISQGWTDDTMHEPFIYTQKKNYHVSRTQQIGDSTIMRWRLSLVEWRKGDAREAEWGDWFFLKATNSECGTSRLKTESKHIGTDTTNMQSLLSEPLYFWGMSEETWSLVELRTKDIVNGSCRGEEIEVERGVSWSH